MHFIAYTFCESLFYTKNIFEKAPVPITFFMMKSERVGWFSLSNFEKRVLDCTYMTFPSSPIYSFTYFIISVLNY